MSQASDLEISAHIQSRLSRERLGEVTAVEAAKWLDEASLLRDSPSRPGRDLRRRLRAGVILGAEQRPNRPNGNWYVVRTPRFDSARFRQAFEMALELHDTQTRKGSDIPYMGHLMGVTSIVIDDGGSESEIIAALLHDGPEDSGGEATLERIREEFGDEVAEIVDHLSDTFEDPKPEWQTRKENYLADLEALPTDDLGRKVLRVSLADKLHNVRSIQLDKHEVGEEIWDRFTGTKEHSLWYYRTLAAIYRQKLGSTALVEEFSDEVEGLDSGAAT